MFAKLTAVLVLFGLFGASSGCSGPTVDLSDEPTRQMLALLMPNRILIDQFTGLKSFDDDATPDGLQVVFRAVDSFGDWVKIAGHVRVELYEFRPAAGERKGQRIQQWDVRLETVQDQRRYWNRYTQMYELPLEMNLALVRPAQRYVIEVTYNTPLAEHVIGEFVYEPSVGDATAQASGG